VSSRAKPEFHFDLSGGQLALDLANTVSRRHDPARRKEHLEHFGDVISFAGQSKLISAREAAALRQHALQHPAEARRSLARLVQLREAIYRVFSAIAQHKAVPTEDLQAVNDAAVEALRHRVLTARNGGFRWEWAEQPGSRLDRLMWPPAQAAADLLTSRELSLVRFCEAPDCEWLFLDHSRNRSRRWCDMTSCGNRAKARRHYQRVRH
jgi:predicted RNA-binding Zn ribbon-like protein